MDTYTVRLSDVPVGDHALRVRAGDGCGNFDVDILEFCVIGRTRRQRPDLYSDDDGHADAGR
jgi:hypothetical protein